MQDENRRTLGTYREYLDKTGPLPRSLEDVLIQLEKEGWECKTYVPARKRGFRYWCPCDKQHNQFVAAEDLTEERLRFLFRPTCFTFKGD